MIMMPITRPAASALSEATSSPRLSPQAAQRRSDRQRGEEAVDHRRDAGQHFQQRLGQSSESADPRTRPGRWPKTGRQAPRSASRCPRSSPCRRNSGTAPKLPEDPTWSVAQSPSADSSRGRTGNRCGGTERKNCIDSYTTESTMPSVTNTASVEQASSTLFANGLDGVARTHVRRDPRARPSSRPTMPSTRITPVSARREMPRRRWYSHGGGHARLAPRPVRESRCPQPGCACRS